MALLPAAGSLGCSKDTQRRRAPILSGLPEPMTVSKLLGLFLNNCHSPKDTLSPPEDWPDIQVSTELTSTIMRLGLHDWVIEKLA